MNEQALDKFIPKNQRSTNKSFKDLQSITLGDRQKTSTSSSKTSKPTTPLANYQPLISGNEERVKIEAEIPKLKEQIEKLEKDNSPEAGRKKYDAKKKMARLVQKQRDYKNQMTSFLDGFINRTIEMAGRKASIKKYDLVYDPSKNSYMLTLIGEVEQEDGSMKDMPINVAPFDLSDTNQLKTLENLLDLQKRGTSGASSPY